MEKKTLRRFDLVTSILLIIGSFLYVLKAIDLFRNPYKLSASELTPEKIAAYKAFWFDSAALLPLVVGCFLFICSIMLLVIALKDGARFDFFTKEKIASIKTNKELRVFAQVVGMLAAFIFILTPLCRNYLDFIPSFQGFPFVVATFIYLFSMMVVFEANKNKKNIIKALIISLVSAIVLVVMFNLVALIPMP